MSVNTFQIVNTGLFGNVIVHKKAEGKEPPAPPEGSEP